MLGLFDISLWQLSRIVNYPLGSPSDVPILPFNVRTPTASSEGWKIETAGSKLTLDLS